MTLAGSKVFFRLTAEGRKALKGLVPANGAFPADVLDEDERGVWVKIGREKQTVRAMLIRWTHFSVAVVEMVVVAEATRSRIGFRAVDSKS